MPETGASESGALDVSTAYATAGGPTSSVMRMILRSVADAPDVELDERTVANFCASLAEAASDLAGRPLATGPVDRARNFHYLLTVVGWAIDAAVLHSEPEAPMFSAPRNTVRTDWGAGNPDGVYRRALLADDQQYRISGRLGNAEYLALDFRLPASTVTLIRDDLAADADGRFELFVGGPERQANWLPLEPDTIWVLTREFFHDWLAAERSIFRIERVDGVPVTPAVHNSRRVAAEWDVIGDWVRAGGVHYWAEHGEDLMAKARNAFLPAPSRTGGKLPPVYRACWDLGPDEALILEIDDPDAAYWGVQLATMLCETLEYANRITSANSSQITPDSDGVYRLVVAGRDPGVANWLDTTGLECGEVILRAFSAKRAPAPRARAVDIARLADELPEARRCSPAERQAQIALRREGVSHMLCD